MAEYSIQIVPIAHQMMRGPGIYNLDGFDDWERFEFHMTFVRGEGKTICIGAGIEQDLSFLDPYWHMWEALEKPIEIEEHMRFDNATAAAGVKPEDVDILILSPLVFYATGNIGRFTNAQICILKRGWLDFHAPPQHGKYTDAIRPLCIPDDAIKHLVTDWWPRVRLLEDEDEIAPGITSFFSGVHHRSSMSINIPTSQGRVIYSDSFFKFRNIEEDIPVGYIESLEEAMRNYERARREGDLFIPAFDPQVMTRYPDGKIG